MALEFIRIDDRLGFVEIPPEPSTCNVYVVGPADDCLLVDSGTAFTVEELIESLQSAGVRAGGVRGIVVTHGHRDHYGGCETLSAHFCAPVWAHPWAAAAIEDPWSAYVAPGAHYDNGADQWQRFLRPGGRPVCIGRLLREGDVIEHAGLRFDVFHTPGHERGQISLHERSLGWLFVGDMVQGGADAAANWLGLFGDIASQRRSLARVAELKPTLLLKGHRRPRRGEQIVDDLAAANDRLRRLEQAALDAMRHNSPLTLAAITRAALADVLKMRPDPLPDYAVHSMHAVLIDLAQRGLARRDGELNWQLSD